VQCSLVTWDPDAPPPAPIKQESSRKQSKTLSSIQERPRKVCYLLQRYYTAQMLILGLVTRSGIHFVSATRICFEPITSSHSGQLRRELAFLSK
jgi:hypothetical protein